MNLGRMRAVVVSLLFLSGACYAEDGFAPGPDQVSPLLVGNALPELVLKTAEGSSFDLNVENARKPLVIVFYRGHW
ncbi:MAG: hypothetical protein O3B73_17595 [bacterium]|jgi:hypothetical protein|nr:hypothetical protein [bacterium]